LLSTERLTPIDKKKPRYIRLFQLGKLGGVAYNTYIYILLVEAFGKAQEKICVNHMVRSLFLFDALVQSMVII
jgi:hypothetical protein